ncbi:DUF3885 domain-containing protein [Paenibacillus prosopidis]|uniref:DUF3885 domain-containing protein n=1 Tax=Paenibacillus prosopidis TaxID=630520 RepID=UPI0011C0250D|nr:hypothetical protein [Paenibacillus prosopidis]
MSKIKGADAAAAFASCKRFELGLSGLEENVYFNEAMQRSHSICNFLFSPKDEVHVINRISYLNENSRHKKLDMHRFF